MGQLGLGMIGCGTMGQSLTKSAADLDCARVVCVSDVDEEKGRELAEGIGSDFEPDYVQMLNREDVQAVMIATPPFLHIEPAVAAAEAGVHVFSEKPMAPTLAGCDEMIEATRSHGVRLGVGLVCRFHPIHQKVRDLAQEGELGTPTCLMAHRLGGGWGDVWDVPWRQLRKKSGGSLMEVNAHEVDFMRFVMGDVESVYAVGGQYVQKDCDFPDIAVVSLRFQNGGVGMLHSSDASAIGGYGGRLDCTEGSAVFPFFWGQEGAVRYKHHEGEEMRLTHQELAIEESPVHQEIRAFCEAILAGIEPPVSGVDGRAATEIALAAYRSIETGESVNLPFVE